MTHSKSNAMIDECLNNVHPGLKTKKDCKYILSIMTKIFVQELIEESLQVVEEYKQANYIKENGESGRKDRRSEEIDVDVIDEAYRRRLMKKESI